MSDSTKSVQRRLELIYLLQSGKKITATKMAEYFKVSKRTIFRDLRALQDLNIPYYHEPGEGYLISSTYKMPPLMFTQKELTSVIMGLSFSKSQRESTFRKDAEAVILKIKNAVTGALKDYINALEDKIIVSPYQDNLSAISNNNKGADWFTFTDAISNHKRLIISYNIKGEITQRKIDPYFLVYYTDHWNVLSYCHLRKAPRKFVLNNISNIEVIPEKYHPNPEFSFDYLLYSDDGNAETFVIKVKKEIIHHFLLDLPGKLIELSAVDNPEYIQARFNFDNSNGYLQNFLIKHLGQFDVIEPSEFNIILKDKIRAILEGL